MPEPPVMAMVRTYRRPYVCLRMTVNDSWVKAPAQPNGASHSWSVVIADDHAVTRSGVKLMLDMLDDVEVVGEASTGAELVEICRRVEPDAVLTDLDMPEMGGVEATEAIRRDFPDLPVLVLTVHEDGDRVLEAMRAGASGYLSKTASADDVHRALNALRAGDTYLTPEVAGVAIRALTERITTHAHTDPSSGSATPREREVLGLVAGGLSARSIARRLGISERTVNTHIGHVYRKLGVNNRVDAVLAGMRAGLVDGPG